MPLIIILVLFAILNLQSLKKNYHNENYIHLSAMSDFIENNLITDSEEMARNFSILFDTETVKLYIFDKGDDLIWQFGNIRDIVVTDIASLEGINDYILTHYGQPSDTYNYYLFSEPYYKKTFPVKLKQVLGFLIILILISSVIILYIFYMIIYSPIKKIRRFIDEELGTSSLDSDDFKAIEEAVSIYHDETEMLKISSIDASEDYIIPKLMHGEYRSVSQFNKEGRPFNMKINPGGFRILLFSLLPGADFSEKQFLIIMDDLKEDDLPGFFRYDHHKYNIDYICTFSDRLYTRQKLKSILENLQKKVETEAGAGMTIGVGDACRDIRDLGKSTIQARTCLDYRIIEGEDEIIFFEEFGNEQQSEYWYSRHYIQDLELLIREGNSKGSEELMNEYINHIREHRYPLFIARCLCFDIVNMIGQILQDINYPELEKSKDSLWNEIQSFTTIDSLASVLVRFSKDIGTSMQMHQSGSRTGLPSITKKYIDNHIFNPDFYLQKLADDLDKSLPYLSQAFKKTYGITMIDYISRSRLKKAEKLLTETSMKVSDIVIEIGYSDRSSFSKKFKAQSGMSPNEFRKMSKENKILKFTSS